MYKQYEYLIKTKEIEVPTVFCFCYAFINLITRLTYYFFRKFERITIYITITNTLLTYFYFFSSVCIYIIICMSMYCIDLTTITIFYTLLANSEFN